MTELLPANVPDEHPVVLFDGICNLCARSVQFLIQRDPEGIFRFAPLQSAVAEELLADHEVDPAALESLVLVEADRVSTKSDAVLGICRHLGGIYRLLPAFGLLPRPVRDWGYEFVAARRYRWFGTRDSCLFPTPDIRSRFLAGGPGENTSS